MWYKNKLILDVDIADRFTGGLLCITEALANFNYYPAARFVFLFVGVFLPSLPACRACRSWPYCCNRLAVFMAVLYIRLCCLVFQGSVRHNMAADALATTAHGNYVAASQPGCHIAHCTADWVIETSAFEAEDYGLEPGEEDGVPDIVVDPETRSLRYDGTFFWILYGLACGLSSAIACNGDAVCT